MCSESPTYLVCREAGCDAAYRDRLQALATAAYEEATARAISARREAQDAAKLEEAKREEAAQVCLLKNIDSGALSRRILRREFHTLTIDECVDVKMVHKQSKQWSEFILCVILDVNIQASHPEWMIL